MNGLSRFLTFYAEIKTAKSKDRLKAVSQFPQSGTKFDLYNSKVLKNKNKSSNKLNLRIK